MKIQKRLQRFGKALGGVLFLIALASCGGGSSSGDNGEIAAPSNLAATATSAGSIDLMWQDNASDETDFLLERSETSATDGFSVAATLPADTQSFSDTGLTPSTTYFYRVAAANASGQSNYSDVASATTDVAPTTSPAAPSALNGSATSSTSADLFWTDNSSNESAFEIYQALGAGAFTLVKTVAANVTTASVGGLSASTLYSFKVVATNLIGPSPDSNTHQITTPVASGTTPATPSAPSVSGATSSSLTVNWVDSSSDETEFRIYRSTSEFGTYTQIATVAANSTNYTNTGLTASTTYWYKLSSFNGAGESAQTAAVSGITSVAPPTIPTTPSDLTVGSPTTSSLTLNWSDNSNNETGFVIYRASSEFGTYFQITTVAANSASYVNSGLSASTTYWYRVAATNTAGTSSQSVSAGATTQAPAVTIPNDPSNPTVTNITDNSARLNWIDNSSNETGFQIGTCSGLILLGSGGLRTCASGFTQVASVGANVTFFNITGLGGNTTYTYFVRATNTAGNSGNTGRSFTTLLGPQTINLVATASNSLQSSSASSANANTSYPNTFPSVGVNTVCGGPFCDTLAFAGLVKYDTSPLVGKTIISATLTLEVNLAPVGFSRQNFDIGTVATPWNPLTITWNGAGSFLYYIDGWIYNNAFPLFSGQLYNFDITSIVQNWASGFFNNNGLILQSSNYLSSPGINSLDAYEFTVPTLTVTYQ